MKLGIKILLALWMSALCMTSYAAIVGGLTGGPVASAAIAGAHTAANKKKPDAKKPKKKRNKQKRQAEAAPVPQLTEEQQRKFDYYFLEAIRLKQAGDYDAAFDLLQHSLAINPHDASALYELAQYYLYLKQPARATATIEQAVAADPDNYWYAQALSQLYLQQNEAEKATVLLEDMVQRFSTRIDPLYSLLEIYNQQEDYDRVLDVLNLLEQRMGKNEQLSLEKFRIYLRKGDNKRAFGEMENLVAEYPQDLRYRVVLGDVYLQNGKKDEAYDIYQQVLAEEPDNAMAMYSLASYYEETGQDSLYQQQLDSLLLNRKVTPDIKSNIMRQLIIRNEQADGDSLRIITLFDRIMQQDPDEPDLPMLYAQYLLSKGMNQQSLPVLRRVLDIDPTNTAARMTLLGEAVRQKDYKGIVNLCEAGIESNPDMLEFYYYLAFGYIQEDNRTDDVLSTCQKALAHVTPESKKEVVSEFYAIMGDSYHTKGMTEQAFAAYDSALVYNPDNIVVLNNYAYYLSLERRDLDRAEEMSYRTVKAEPGNATYLDTYAWVLFEKGNYAEARLYIDDAMKNGGGESSGVAEHCGDIYYMTGDVDGALKYWKQAWDMGIRTDVLKEKIEKKKYIPAD
jgi:tetratricopeptide (TPR) repeat protein